MPQWEGISNVELQAMPSMGNSVPTEGKGFHYLFLDPKCTILRQNSAKVSDDPKLLFREAGAELPPFL